MQGKPHNITNGQFPRKYSTGDLVNDLNDDLVYADGHCDPISGSDADCTFDEDEIAEYARMIGMVPCPVHMPDRFEKFILGYCSQD